MRDDFAIDDGAHLVGELLLVVLFGLFALFRLYRSLLYPDVTDFYFSAMLAFTIPALALIHGLAVSIALVGVKRRGNVLAFVEWVTDNKCFIGFHALLHGGFHLWFQADGYLLFAIEHILGNLLLEVTADDMVHNVESFLHGSALEGIVGELAQLFVTQVIDKVLQGGCGLDSQRLLLCIDDDTMGRQAFLPLLIGEIDIGSDEFVVWLGRFLRSRTGNHGWKDILKVFQWVLHCWCFLPTFVIVAVAATFEFARAQTSVGMFGYHGDTGHSAEVETILHSRCPAQVTFSVAMQSHGDTSVDITGGNIG